MSTINNKNLLGSNGASVSKVGTDAGQQVFDALKQGNPIQEFLYKLPIEELRTYFTDPNASRETFIQELSKIIGAYIEFEKIIEDNPVIMQYFKHDVRTAGTIKGVLEAITMVESIDHSGYISYVAPAANILLSFFESLYYVAGLKEGFIEEKKKNFSLFEAIDIAYKASGVKTGGAQDLLMKGLQGAHDLSIFGIEGDFKIFLMNIFKNAQKHGKATWIKLSVKKIDGKPVLSLQDNGHGISEDMLPHIFDSGVSGGESTGIGLRDLEKRGLKVSVDNEGLPSKYAQAGEEKMGARFLIQLS